MSTGSATSDSHDFSNYNDNGTQLSPPSWNPEFKQPFKKIHKYKVLLFFQMWATKRKNTFPITSTYSSLLFLTSMLQQATWASNLLVSSRWFVGLRFQAIDWGSPRSVWPMLQVSGWSIKGSIFLKVGNGKSRGWPSWSQVSWDFWGCFWKTGLGWVKSHASMS